MTLPETPKHTPCPADTVLEELALGRLTPDKAAAVAAHVRSCDGCRERVAALREEGGLFAAALAAQHLEPRGSCLDAELLAQYVDQTLSEEERAVADAHLASCRRCQARLVTLYRELTALRREQDEGGPLGESARYEAEESVAREPVSAPRPEVTKQATAQGLRARHENGVGVLLLIAGGGCAVAVGFWPGSGAGLLRLMAALLLAGGITHLSLRRIAPGGKEAARSASGRGVSRVLVGVAGLCAVIAAGGTSLSFAWWAAAVVSFHFWLAKARESQRNAWKDEKQETPETALTPEKRKERSM